ncbi:hypothetical protein M5O73_000097 [Escherichia coli]|nr:hypothetical protein [Escherichia coli]EJE7554115.1 hypothetical protein [Escherichia coli]NUD81954.1 hypothetical protein [Escherichia coli]
MTKNTRFSPEVRQRAVRMVLETRAESDAVNEVGFFGNQNTVCKPTTPKWRHTVDKLKRIFYVGMLNGQSKRGWNEVC